MLGWINASLKSTETRDELSTTLIPTILNKFLLNIRHSVETEDDCSGQSDSENRECIDRTTYAYRGKTGFST